MKKISKNKVLILLGLFLSFSINSFSQVLITDDGSTSPDGSAMLEIKSNDKGMLIPRMTTANREALHNSLTAKPGLLVFDSDLGSFFIYGITAKEINGWVDLSNGGTVWEKSGNNIYLANSSYNVGIGTNKPSKKLVIKAENQNDTLFEILDSYGKPLMIITPTLSKFYFNETNTKGVASGFAVGRYAGAKNISDTALFLVTPDSTRVYTSGVTTKGVAGGFAVGRYAGAKGDNAFKYFYTDLDSTRVYTDGNGTKGVAGGFAVGRYAGAKSDPSTYMYMTKENYFIGHKAGLNTTPGVDPTGLYNLFFGYESALDNTTGYQNTFIGHNTGHGNVEGYQNVFIGSGSGYNNKYGIHNLFAGFRSGTNNTGIAGDEIAGSHNVFLGYEAGYENTTGADNILIGWLAGHENTTAGSNICIGSKAGYSNTIASNNIFMGEFAGEYHTDGTNNIYLGYKSGQGDATNTETGYNNVFIGNSTGSLNQTGQDNVFLGTESGLVNTTGSDNVFIGNQAGHSNEVGENNIFIGNYAGKSIVGVSGTLQGSDNVFIGNTAGQTNENGLYNTMIGTDAGTYATGSFNTFLGKSSGRKSTTSYNTYIGTSTATYNENGYENVVIGHYANFWSTGGSKNVIIGKNAASLSSGETIGDGNVLIGWNVAKNETNISNKLFIDNSETSTPLIYGDFGLNKIGINTNNPQGDLHVVGSDTLGRIVIAPNETSANYDAEICLAEDDDYTLGMSIKYDGGDNRMYLFGKSDATYYGPHMSIERNSGRVGIGTGTNVATAMLHIKQVGDYEEGLTIENDGDTDTWSWEIGGNDLNLSFNGTNVGWWDDATGNYNATSDKRLKKDITQIDSGILKKVLSLNPVSYRLLHANNNSKKIIGFIAQDVQKHIPEIVYEREDGYLSLHYSDFGVLAIKAIQEQQAQIEQQNTKISNLEKQIQELKELIQNK